MQIDMNFRGMRWQMPEVSQGQNWASVAHNMHRINSALQPLRKGVRSANLPTADFRFASSFYLHDDKFVAHQSDIDFATTQIIGDVARRMYYVDNGILQFLAYNEIADNYPTNVVEGHRSGVEMPKVTPIVQSQIRAFNEQGQDVGSASYLSLTTEQRALYQETVFVSTLVNRFGEEGPPTLTSVPCYGIPGETLMALFGIAQVPESGVLDSDAAGMRVYMLVNGGFFRIPEPSVTFPAGTNTAEIPNLTALYDYENIPNDTLNLGVITFDPDGVQEELVSSDWDQAPNGLKHLAALDAGVLAVANDHDVFLSVPYQWHAFPEINRYTVIGTIRKIANVGGGFCVMTDRGTEFFFGSDPEAMIKSAVVFPFSIADPKSFTEYEGGGIFVCNDGVAVISSNGVEIATDGFIDREQWLERVSVDECRTEMYEGRILIATRRPDNGDPIGYCINLAAGEVTSFDVVESTLDSGFFRDPRTNEVCFVNNDVGLNVFNQGDRNVAIWESGDIWLPRTISLNSLYVEAESYPVTVKVTAGDLPQRELVVDSERPRRMPITGRHKKIRVRVESGRDVGRCALATDMKSF